MYITQLNLEQVREIYFAYVCKTFPPAELKPYWKLAEAYAKGRYRCYGLWEGEELQAYAFFMSTPKQDGLLLLDYFAVLPGKKSKGYGSAFLALLGEQEQCSIIGEVDDPAYGDTPEEVETRRRRVSFYLRAGFVDMQVRCKFYGVEYRILARNLPQPPDRSPVAYVRQLYGMLYDPKVYRMPANRLRFMPDGHPKKKFPRKK